LADRELTGAGASVRTIVRTATREVAWSFWWCWIVHLIARLLF
jgi:hypothetical protein